MISVCKKVSGIITVSDACKNMLTKNGILSDKIVVAHNAISIQPEPYTDKNDKHIIIGFVGSAIYRKGFDLFICIINKLQKTMELNNIDKEVSALVITNSDNNNAFLCENVEKLDNKIHLRIYHKIDRENVMNLYKEMNLLLVPSRFDPLPTVVLESYMKGTPVIGTAKDGMLEMQVSDIMMFANEDVDEAVSSIVRWIQSSSEEKKILIKRTQNHILQDFTEQNKKRNYL